MAIMISGFKRKVAIVAIISMMITLIPVYSAATVASDISGHWARETIQNWEEQHFINGYPDGTFKPDNNITRGELIGLINRAFKFTKSAPTSFTDVKATDWYFASIGIGVEAGYLSGYPDGTVKPDNPISREELATIIMKLHKLAGNPGAAGVFTDAASLLWSKDAVGAVFAAGIMNGYPDGSFGPHKMIKRGETVVSLDRALKYKATPITPPAPSVTRNDDTDTTSGMTGGMEYKLDSGDWAMYISNIFSALDLSGNHTLLVRFAASGINPYGPSTTLTFTTAVVGGGGGGGGVIVSPSTVKDITNADVTLTSGSIIFGYTFSGEAGSVTYGQSIAAPYYLNSNASTVTLANSTRSAVATLSSLGISNEGTVSYANRAAVQSKFAGLDFIPTQIVLHLTGATSVNSGANAWTKDVTVILEGTEISLLTPSTADILAAAKVTALADLATAFGGYTSTNYTTDNWTSLSGINTAGITAIGAATDLAGVSSALSTAIAGMDGVAILKEITGFTPLVDVDLDVDQHLITFADLKASGNLPTTVTVTDGTTSVAADITDWTESYAYQPILDHGGTLKAVWAMPEGYRDVTSPIAIYLHVNVNAEQTNPPIEVTSFDPLATVEITTDSGLVNLASLQGRLPESVKVYAGTDFTVAVITDWTGTYNGYTTGQSILTAKWDVPVGYVDASPTAITIIVDVQVEQTNQIESLDRATLDKIYYNTGDEIDLTSLVVHVNYADGNSFDVAYAEFVAFGIEVSINTTSGGTTYIPLANMTELLENGERDIQIMGGNGSIGLVIYVGETPVVDIAVTSDPVYEGDTLENSFFHGTFKNSSEQPVTGVLQWDDFAAPPIVESGIKYAWTFWPDETNNYIPVHGTLEVQVLPK